VTRPLHDLYTLAHEFGHYLSWRRSRPADDTTTPNAESAAWRAYFAAAKKRDAAWQCVDARFPNGADEDMYTSALRDAALRRELSDEEKRLILAEETRAWEYGREALADAGWTEFAEYDELTAAGLHNHRYRMALVDNVQRTR
jgi:hypothetical protein